MEAILTGNIYYYVLYRMFGTFGDIQCYTLCLHLLPVAIDSYLPVFLFDH